MGTAKIEVFRSFLSDGHRAAAADASFERSYEALVAGGAARPVPGAPELIEDLRAGGVKVALTTGFSVPTRQALLDALDFSDRVDLALSPSDAGRGRPFPDMVLTAVLALGVTAWPPSPSPAIRRRTCRVGAGPARRSWPGSSPARTTEIGCGRPEPSMSSIRSPTSAP